MLVWSLALLTKIHAWFLLPILGVWAFIKLPPRRALAAWSVWAIVGDRLVLAGLALALVRHLARGCKASGAPE